MSFIYSCTFDHVESRCMMHACLFHFCSLNARRNVGLRTGSSLRTPPRTKCDDGMLRLLRHQAGSSANQQRTIEFGRERESRQERAQRRCTCSVERTALHHPLPAYLPTVQFSFVCASSILSAVDPFPSIRPVSRFPSPSLHRHRVLPLYLVPSLLARLARLTSQLASFL